MNRQNIISNCKIINKKERKKIAWARMNLARAKIPSLKWESTSFERKSIWQYLLFLQITRLYYTCRVIFSSKFAWATFSHLSETNKKWFLKKISFYLLSSINNIQSSKYYIKYPNTSNLCTIIYMTKKDQLKVKVFKYIKYIYKYIRQKKIKLRAYTP